MTESDVNLRQAAPDVRYESVTNVLEATDYEWEEVEVEDTREYVFEAEITPVHTLRFYSSVDVRDDEGRAPGSDRFRLILMDAYTGMPLMPKAVQKNRVILWRPNLLEAIEGIAQPVEHVRECPECGRALVRSYNKNTEESFWSCQSYRLDDVDYCGYTADLDEH